MNRSARTEEDVSGHMVAEPGCHFATDDRTRDRQAAVEYLRSAGAADDVMERDYLRRMAAELVLSKPA